MQGCPQWSGGMNWHEHINQNPDVMAGKPCIKGTRLTVEFVLEQLGNGWSVADLADNHGLRPEQVRAIEVGRVKGESQRRT